MKAFSVRELKNNPSVVLRAAALYREQSLSLGHAARFAGLATGDFISHLSRLGIPVVRGNAASVHEDTEVVAAWRKGSSQQMPDP